MINLMAPPASFSSGLATRAIFKMTPLTKNIQFVKSIFAGLGGVGWLGLFANAAVAQTAVMSSGLPLYFEANLGQVDSPAQFIARGHDSQFLISPDSAQFILRKTTATRA